MPAQSQQNGAAHLTAIGRDWGQFTALCVLVVLPTLAWAADDPEFTIELTSTWRSQTRTNHHRKTATCIVGSNDWFISGDFLHNGKIDYWLVGTNLIEHRVITSSMYLEQAKEFLSERILHKKPPLGAVISYPHAGDTFTTIHSSPLGQPAFCGVEGVIWLAFCSENYLKHADRQIPMPIGPSSHAFGYSDKTVLLQSGVGLPKSVELFATNGTPVCKYEVMESTNYFGRTFPLQFRVIQRGQPSKGAARAASVSEVLGRVISLRAGKPPEFPVELRNRLKP